MFDGAVHTGPTQLGVNKAVCLTSLRWWLQEGIGLWSQPASCPKQEAQLTQKHQLLVISHRDDIVAIVARPAWLICCRLLTGRFDFTWSAVLRLASPWHQWRLSNVTANTNHFFMNQYVFTGNEPVIRRIKSCPDLIQNAFTQQWVHLAAEQAVWYYFNINHSKPQRIYVNSLQWRHNGRDGVSNHQPHDCLLNRLFKRRSKKTSKLRVTGLKFVRGIHPWPVNSPHKWPVTRKMVPFDDVIVW